MAQPLSSMNDDQEVCSETLRVITVCRTRLHTFAEPDAYRHVHIHCTTLSGGDQLHACAYVGSPGIKYVLQRTAMCAGRVKAVLPGPQA